MAPFPFPPWAAELAGLTPEDRVLPADFPGVNLALNRARLARFLAEFAEDGDVRDLLLVDLLGVAIDAPVSSTGTVEDVPMLALRPFRLWEYTWLYKGLELDAGGLDVLDLGGPASHPVILAALAGNRVVSVDINPAIVEAARSCAEALSLKSLEPRVGDMRDLSGFPPGSFDVILCCSVLEHLTGDDQERSLREMARLLRPGGRIGLTFDYGFPAPGANEHLPPPHEPPESAAEVVQRYTQSGLTVVGNAMSDEPIGGSLFHDAVVRYVMGVLFLGKPPLKHIKPPRSKPGKRSALSTVLVGRFPERLCRHSAGLVARLQRVSQIEAGLRQNVESMQNIAAERLAALDAASAELSRVRSDAELRAAELERATAEANALRATADERLNEMHRKDAAIASLAAKLELRNAELERAAAEANALRATADERLNEMQLKEAVIQEFLSKAERQSEILDRLSAEIGSLRSEDDRVRSEAGQLGSEVQQLTRARDELARRIRGFEAESLVAYLRRRWKKK